MDATDTELERLPEVETVSGDDGEADNAVLDRALRIVTGDREAAQKLHNDLSTEREESYRYYRGKALGNEREGRSKVVSSDVMDAVEWIMPSLMRIYFSSDIVSCEPIGEEDTEAAERVAALLNYQFLRRGNGFTAAYKWFKDALVYGLGVLKITWEDRERTTSFRESELPQSEFEALSSDPKVRVRRFEEAPPIPPDEATLQQMMQSVLSQLPPEMPPEQQQAVLAQAMQQMMQQMPKVFRNIVGTQRVMDYSGPVYEVIAPEDFYYDPEAEELADARFAIHRVFRSPDYLRRMEDAGVYSNVQEALERQSAGKRDVQADAEKLERFADQDRSAPWDQTVGIEDEQKRAPVEVWEWWGDFDPEDDGRMEPYVITVANEVVIRCEPNPYDHGETPFEVLRPILDVHKFEGISIADLVKEFQDVKTSLRRQILDNISWQNNGMWEVARSGGVDLESLKNPRPGGIVRVDIAGSIRPLTPPPLQQGPYMAMEFEQTQAEQRTGVTRYNQGLDAKSLNKTATGVTAIMGASQQRLELIARLFAETGVQRTFVKSLALNRQFMNDQFVARLYNKPIEINRDDISGQFDILVSVGISAGQQEMRQQQLMQLLNMGPGLSQTGVMTPDNVYEVLCKLLQGWGFKDFQRYASDPQFVQQMQMQMQSLQQQLQQMQQQLQQSQAQTQQMGAILQHPAVAPVAAQVLQQQMAEQPPGAQQPPQQQMPPVDAQPVPQGPPMMIGSAV